MVSKLLYNLFLFFYFFGIRVAALWNIKAKQWLSGRKKIFTLINSQLLKDNLSSSVIGQPIWMHCASLGEFEQGRPILELLKKNNPAQKIVLTFFSPSGYQIMKSYHGVDHVFYLPMDSSGNAKKFLDAINPSLVIWVKYEYWFYYLCEIKKRNIPTILVSGIFRKSQPFFAWYGDIWKQMLETFTHFFVQNSASAILLTFLGYKQNVTINGDTRFDRVLQILDNFMPVLHIETFCGDSQVIVAGSTWLEDEVELLHFINTHPAIKFIIAPHEIDKTNLLDLKEQFPRSIFYSALVKLKSNSNLQEHIDEEGVVFIHKHDIPNILIIDNIGMLSRLYKYATIAYVGGGFGADGVHNILEAAVYGKPVVFGPVYEKFDEAIGLINADGGISVDGPVSLEATMNKLLINDIERNRMGDAAKHFVNRNTGASKKIIQFIQEKRLLTS